MEINKRIIALIEILGLTPSEFADKIQVQRSGISHITSGRNKPSLDFLESTLRCFPEINSDWLILGKGKPLKSQNNEDNSSIKTEDASYLEPIETLSSPLLFPLDDDNRKSEEQNPEEIIKSTFNENTTNSNKIKDSHSNEKLNKENTNEKEIQKIIILYTDHSFEVYKNKKD